MSYLIDNHSHLQHEKIINNKEDIIKKINETMAYVVVSGANHEWNIKAIEEFSSYEKIYLTLGIHPVESVNMSEKEFDEALEFIYSKSKENNKVIGIGEIGMDFHWVKDPLKIKVMEERFIKQIDIANELKLPIIVHSWDAEKEAILLSAKYKNDNKVVFHCYSSHKNHELIHEYNFYASVCTNITRAKNVKKHAKRLNLENMLTETDSPYLSPTPGEINYPWNVSVIIEKVSQLKDVSKEEVEKQIYNNFIDLYELK